MDKKYLKKSILKTMLVFLGTLSAVSCTQTLPPDSEGEVSSQPTDSKPTETIKPGAYFITNESWETYARDWANSTKHLVENFNEDFIQKVINETVTIDDSYGLELFPPSKNSLWAVINNDLLTLSTERAKVYTFVHSGDYYEATSFNSLISFKLHNDILTITMNSGNIQFRFDNSYVLTDNKIMLDKPSNIEYSSGGEGLNYLYLQWPYQAGFGFFGTSVEIKKANKDEFTLIRVEQTYHNTIVVQRERGDFALGTNILRLGNIGGPSITNTKEIITYLDSAYVDFKVVINADNNITVEPISF